MAAEKGGVTRVLFVKDVFRYRAASGGQMRLDREPSITRFHYTITAYVAPLIRVVRLHVGGPDAGSGDGWRDPLALPDALDLTAIEAALIDLNITEATLPHFETEEVARDAYREDGAAEAAEPTEPEAELAETFGG